ncbi:MAG: agmatinase [Desulfobacteraceae bacterium]
MAFDTFFDLDPLPVEKAEAIVLPASYEATTTYGTGTRFGPEAILAASRQVELWDEELDWDPSQAIRLATAREISPEAAGPAAMVEKIKRVIHPLVAQDKLLITIGGEHTITLALVQTYLTRYPDLTVIALDAHADFRDKYQNSPFSHACVLRRVWELGRPLVLIGVRSYSAEEYELIKVAPRLTLLKAAHLHDPEYWNLALENLGRIKGPVYLSIDLDVLDPAVLPATGTPEPGGLSYYQVLKLMKAITARGPVIGLDLVELAPIPGHRVSEFTVARLLYKFLAYRYQDRRPR